MCILVCMTDLYYFLEINVRDFAIMNTDSE